MAQVDWVTVGGFIVVLGFMWRIQRDIHNDITKLRDQVAKDIGDLRERMAKVEGLLAAYMNLNRMKRGSHDE